MNGLISYLPESEVVVAQLDLSSPTTGGVAYAYGVVPVGNMLSCTA